LTNRTAFVQIGESTSYSWNLPIGCVQGSVLGPILFNIYMRELPKIIKSVDTTSFVLSYADDSYIALSCDRINYKSACVTINDIFVKHKQWLGELGMVCNPTKTEFTVFGSKDSELKIKLGNENFKPLEAVKILGVMFDRQLNWNIHASKVIKECSSLSYSLTLLNNILPRHIHRQVIFSHFISHLMYASPIWASCLTSRDTDRLSACLNKTLRLHCFDFLKTKTNSDLCRESNIRSFKSLRTLYDAKMLFKLVTQCDNLSLTSRLTSQPIFYLRFPGRMSFSDISRKRVGRNSFMNRAKFIAETIPFEWLDMSPTMFALTLKRRMPVYMWKGETLLIAKFSSFNCAFKSFINFIQLQLRLSCLSCFIALDK